MSPLQTQREIFCRTQKNHNPLRQRIPADTGSDAYVFDQGSQPTQLKEKESQGLDARRRNVFPSAKSVTMA